MESLSINDSPTLLTQQTRAYYPFATPRIPPSVLPTTLSMPMTNEGTWKRISRSDIGIDIVMEEAMGEKRSARSTEIQSKLQEKRKGKKKKEKFLRWAIKANRYWWRLVSSPTRSNEYHMLELLGA